MLGGNGGEGVCLPLVCVSLLGNMEVSKGLREELGTVKSEPKHKRRQNAEKANLSMRGKEDSQMSIR